MRKTILLAVLLCLALGAAAQQTSVAGFYPLENSGRIVYNFNEGWRFHLGDVPNAESLLFDDSSWEVVCAPHPVRLDPSEVSGGRNYQGVCWYRKRFTVPADMEGKSITVHFEAVMGKQQVFVNGRVITDKSTRLKEGDILSVRGFGKAVYDGIEYETKKSRLWVSLRKYV